MQLRDFLSAKPKNNRFYTIAIDGRGGSGKTSFVEYIKTLLPDFICINGDDYFEPVENQIAWGVFNDERLNSEIIKPLKTSNTFSYRRFDWETMQYISQNIIVNKGFVLERCYSFLFDLDWDLKIWIETPRQVCLERAIEQAHMPKDRIVAAWNEIWQPQEDKYIQEKQPMEQADIIIYGDKPFEEQIIF